MTLFLGGGGDVKDSVLIDREFFKNLNDNSKILYICSAWDADTYEGCLPWFKGLVATYLKTPEKNITMIYDQEDAPELDKFDAVYIGGGNTYKLLDYLCRTRLKEKLIAYLQKGGLAFGGSAGAIIFGETIAAVPEEKENYPEHKAIASVKNYALRCHYQESKDELYKELSQTVDYPLILMPETGGMICEGNHLRVIGEAFLFEKGQKIGNFKGL